MLVSSELLFESKIMLKFYLYNVMFSADFHFLLLFLKLILVVYYFYVKPDLRSNHFMFTFHRDFFSTATSWIISFLSAVMKSISFSFFCSVLSRPTLEFLVEEGIHNKWLSYCQKSINLSPLSFLPSFPKFPIVDFVSSFLNK